MVLRESHYTSYLISVHFDKGFLPDSLSGQVEVCENFMDDLGSLARKSGRRLYGTFSICSGDNGVHAHFGVSWLPIVLSRVKTANMRNQPIARYPVVNLLSDNFFYVDNPKEAIKKVTHDKTFVTDYIINQPKSGQSTIYTAFYIHPDFTPSLREKKIHSYCSKRQFDYFQKNQKSGCITKIYTLLLISLLPLLLISLRLLTLF